MRVRETSRQAKPTRRSADGLTARVAIFSKWDHLPMLASTLFPTTITVETPELLNGCIKNKRRNLDGLRRLYGYLKMTRKYYSSVFRAFFIAFAVAMMMLNSVSSFISSSIASSCRRVVVLLLVVSGKKKWSTEILNMVTIS